MKKYFVVFVLLLSVLLAGGCAKKEATAPKSQPQPAKTVTLNIAAAASLKDAASELQSIYAKKHPEVKINYNLAASGTLQQQIEQGAPTDLFISAGKKQMDALGQENLIVADSRKDLLGNKLVLVTGKNSTLKDFNGLTDTAIKKISIGTPETVPAGKYAQDTLTSLNLYNQIQPKLVLAKDVKQVLTYVQTGNVDAGLVYFSDTYKVNDIKIVATAPEDSHKPIVYPMAIVKASKNQSAAQSFAEFLASPEAAKVFSKYGFEPLQK
jgi:molybdate transport system substrate-binding protein